MPAPMENMNACPVCDRQTDTVLSCSHLLCTHCQERWFSKQSTCPLCRRVVSSAFNGADKCTSPRVTVPDDADGEDISGVAIRVPHESEHYSSDDIEDTVRDEVDTELTFRIMGAASAEEIDAILRTRRRSLFSRLCDFKRTLLRHFGMVRR